MRSIRVVVGTLALGVLSLACAIPAKMAQPVPSARSFSDPGAARVTLKLLDGRVGDETTFHVRQANVALSGIDKPMAFLAGALGAEFTARGYPVSVVTDPAAQADLELRVTRYRVITRRGHLTEAAHQFRGVLTAGPRQIPITAYFFHGRWWVTDEAFSELVYSTPQSFLVKEIASKVNRAALGLRSGDDVVEGLLERARPKEGQNNGPYMEIIELAGTNNPRAMEALKRYAGSSDEFVRAVALDGMGILGSGQEVEFLKAQYTALKGTDRIMALKAIGDAGDEVSLAFVHAQTSDKDYSGEAAMKHLVDLYSGK